MEQLWAPWRVELVDQPNEQHTSGCVFCTLPRVQAEAGQRAARDREALVLGRTEHTFALINRWPYNNGHIMVIPRRHTNKLDELQGDEWTELQEMLRIANGIVTEAYRPQGTNLGMNLGRPAGAGIEDHLHWHLVPRWNGDTNFMPVLGDVKVMIEHLTASWDRMRPLFDARFHRGPAVSEWPAEDGGKK